MTKRKVSQLFAVVVVGISAPAAASPDASRPMAPRTLPSGAPAAGNAQAKPMPRSTPMRSPTPAAVPRTLPTGAPACGNVQGKGRVEPCTPSQQAARPSRAVPPPVTPVVAMPRTLPSGAPACGNVLAKLNGDKTEVAYQNCLKGIDPTEYVRQAMVIQKLLVAVGLRSAASYQVAKPREYKSGAPACGNVATRSGMRARTNCQ
jgi:hypothetical protein